MSSKIIITFKNQKPSISLLNIIYISSKCSYLKGRYIEETVGVLDMGTALITIKIMPSAPDSNLEEIQSKAEAIIQEHEGEKPNAKTEPVAFGLNSLNISFSRDENLDNDEMLEKIQNIENVSSAEITDFRRAFG